TSPSHCTHAMRAEPAHAAHPLPVATRLLGSARFMRHAVSHGILSMRLLTSAAAIAAALILPVAAYAADAPVQIALDASRPGAVIDRNIFGQFAEHLGSGIYGGIWVGKDSTIPNTRGIRKDVVAALKALKVPNVRWPGGCFADQYNWRRGIGPERKAAVG